MGRVAGGCCGLGDLLPSGAERQAWCQLLVELMSDTLTAGEQRFWRLPPSGSSPVAGGSGDGGLDGQSRSPIAAAVWLVGMAAMAAVSALCGLRLHAMDGGAAGGRRGESEQPLPPLCWVYPPCIYLPFQLGPAGLQKLPMRTIRHRDHWVKPLAVAMVKWFNPWGGAYPAVLDME